VSLSQKKEQKKAIEEVKKAIELDPAFAEAHENLTKLILSSNTDTRQFWQFWMTSKKRLVVPIILGVLAAGLVLYSLYTGSEVMTTNEEIKDGKRSITINTSREHKIPETYLIVLGLIAVILLAPEIKIAKVGPVELNVSKEPLVPLR
jgi:hypothetical protein